MNWTIITYIVIALLVLTVFVLNTDVINLKKENKKLKALLKDTKYADILHVLTDDEK